VSTRVVNRRVDAFDIYIGRPSKWGNPYSHKKDTLAEFKVKNRAAALAAYEEWIRSQPDLLAALPELKDRVLGCWCKPKACHGDILARLADNPPEPETEKPAEDKKQLALF
jgi:hypothetical protein